MSPYVDAPARYVLVADLSEEAPAASIEVAMTSYRQAYGNIRHVWVNPKDCPDSLLEVSGTLLERQSECPRGKIMVM